MKTKGLVICMLCTLSLLCGVCAGIYSGSRSEKNGYMAQAEQISSSPIPLVTPVQTLEPQKAVALREQYIVTLTDTKIIIYRINADGSMQLTEEKETDALCISDEDYALLYKGITVNTLEEAKEIVEDYVS